MVNVALHWDSQAREEWLVLQVRLTRLLAWAHGACFYGCNLCKTISGFLPTRPDLRILFLDLTEYRLRAWCEVRSRPPTGELYRTIYNGSPSLVRVAMLCLGHLARCP